MGVGEAGAKGAEDGGRMTPFQTAQEIILNYLLWLVVVPTIAASFGCFVYWFACECFRQAGYREKGK